MSDAYHRVRKGYGVVAGLLLAWELLDIQFTSISAIGVTFATPTNVPHALAALLGYFGIRFVVEWFQCDADRRNRVASKIDFIFAHTLAIVGLVVYFAQRHLDIPVAGLFGLGFLTGLLVGFLSLLGVCEIYRFLSEGQTDKIRMIVFFSLAIVPVALLILTLVTTVDPGAVALGALVGGIGAFAMWSTLRKILHR